MTLSPVPPLAHPLAPDLLAAVMAERSRHVAFVRQQMPSVSDPEDVVQLALLRAAQHLGEVRDDEKLGSWFWSILRRTILDEAERRTREHRTHAELAQASDGPSPQQVASCACSLGVLEGLKLEYRELLERVDLREESIEQVAASEGISRNNATVRLHRARKAMREALLGHCGTDSLRACQDCGCEDAPVSR